MAEQPETSQRREAFIVDIVEVCKKHRVMLDTEDGDEIYDAYFREHPSGGDGHSFNVSIDSIEITIRREVWDTIHGGG